MKDKIAEVISKYDLKPDTNQYMTGWQCRDLAQDIVDLIAKELPKEKVYGPSDSEGNYWTRIYNDAIREFRHKLEVE